MKRGQTELPEFSVDWYRTPIDPKKFAELHQTSDSKAFLQAGGCLGLLLTTASLAVVSSRWWSPAVTLFFVFLYGVQANFLINGMHELGHGAVFKTKVLNSIFLRILSFLGWLHPDMFFQSHLRHHRYTLYFPAYDQENPLPITFNLRDFLKSGFVNIRGPYETIKMAVVIAMEQYPTHHLGWSTIWEEVCYPPDQPHLRRPATLWARTMLAGHFLILVVSLYYGYWMIPIVISLGPFCGGILFLLCNSTQHIGLHPNTNDFRFNCRTFTLHPFIRFLYWQMNFHIEHHMYANVPCYNLAELHETIKHDLPPTPEGIVGVWDVIGEILRQQKNNPDFCQTISLPATANPSPSTNKN
jgi:fatty acid desaturase